jgi:four helix bundle protein
MRNDSAAQVTLLRVRTKRFALSVVKLAGRLSGNEPARVVGRQLLRSATSVAANYRAAGRARSRKEFAARLGVVLEEADESAFWLEILREADIASDFNDLEREATELVRIFSAAYRTALQPPRRPILRS